MKTYQTLRDIVRSIADFHGKLREFYHTLESREERGRVRMLLYYMSRHEKRFEDSLRTVGQSRKKGILDTWLQYVPGDELLSLDGLDVSSDMSVDEVVRISLEFDERLREFIRGIAGNPGLPRDVQDMFTQIAEEEKSEESELSVIADQIKGM